MIRKSKKTASLVKKTELNKYKHILLVLVLSLLVILLISYGLLTVLTRNTSLPRLTLMNNSVELKSADELTAYMEKIGNANLKRSIRITIDDQTTEKTVADFKVEIDNANTVKRIINFGKSYETFPNLTYFKAIFSHKTEITPVFTWEGDTASILESLPNSTKEAENAKFVANGQNISIENEKDGYELDMETFRNNLENCLADGCPGGIKAAAIPTKAKISSSDLSPFLNKASDALKTGLILNASEKYKKYSVESADIISFIDYDQTIEKNTLWWGQSNIETYLKDKIAPQIDTSGKKRKISSYDGSVISQGTKGYGLQITSSAETVKSALIEGKSTARLAIGTTDIVDEYVSPGFVISRVEGKYIDVNLSQQMLYTLEGDKLIGSYRVSTGKWSKPTPVGQYAVNDKKDMAFSATYHLYMPYWMAFIGSSYGIHELPETPSGKKEGASSLGVPVSHGCVRLGVGDAKTVYDWAEIGTPVFIHK